MLQYGGADGVDTTLTQSLPWYLVPRLGGVAGRNEGEGIGTKFFSALTGVTLNLAQQTLSSPPWI